MAEITIIKLDEHGEEKVRYRGEVLDQGATWICLRAVFRFPDVDMGVTRLRTGDVFTEWFYSDRWYNVFRVDDGDSGQLKGWYCNITRPATITADCVAAEDLALDVFVTPEGEVLVLDEDEFAALNLSADEQALAWHAVDTIRQRVAGRATPFADVRSTCHDK